MDNLILESKKNTFNFKQRILPGMNDERSLTCTSYTIQKKIYLFNVI